MNLEYKSCRVTIDIRPDCLYLFSLITHSWDRGKGDATRLLRCVRKLAEKKGMTVRLRANPFYFCDSPKHPSPYVFDLDRLVKFYEKRGFKQIETNNYTCLMELIPRKRR